MQLATAAEPLGEVSSRGSMLTLRPVRFAVGFDKQKIVPQFHSPWQVIYSEPLSPTVSLVDSYYKAECAGASLAALSTDEQCAVEVLQCFHAQRHQAFSIGRAQMPPAHRRSKSDADLKYATADPSLTPANLFRRDPEISSSTSSQALQNLVLNLESQLAEAHHEIRVVRGERDEMARERDEQQQILWDAERQMDDVLHRHHHDYHLKHYMDDLRHLHEMIYSYEASLREAGIEPSALRYRSSIQVLRSQLHFPIKAPHGRPGHASSTLARSAHTDFMTPPLTPDSRHPVDLPEVAPTLQFTPFHRALFGAHEGLDIPRCVSPESI